MSVHHVVLPATFIALILVDPLSLTISETINELTSKHTVSIDPLLSSTAMLHVISPFTLIDSSHGICVCPLSMCHGHLEVAHVLVTQAVNEDAVAACVAQVPIPDIASPIRPIHAPLSIPEATQPIAYVNCTILISVLSILVLHPAQTMCRRKRLKKLISGEVACMHAIHIAHLDTLLDRLARDAPSDEGLYFNDGFDVTLEHLLHFVVGEDSMGRLVQVALIEHVLAIFEPIWQLLQVLALNGDPLRSVAICTLSHLFITLIDFKLLITFVL